MYPRYEWSCGEIWYIDGDGQRRHAANLVDGHDEPIELISHATLGAAVAHGRQIVEARRRRDEGARLAVLLALIIGAAWFLLARLHLLHFLFRGAP